MTFICNCKQCSGFAPEDEEESRPDPGEFVGLDGKVKRAHPWFDYEKPTGQQPQKPENDELDTW